MLEQTSSVEILVDFGPAIGSRINQAFPDLKPEEIERLRRFGNVKRYADGERMFAAGKPRGGMFVMLKGRVAVSQRDGLGHVTPILKQGPGQFLAEVGTLSERPSFVDGHAEGEVEALVIPSERLRALLIAEAELGERLMRALILRRVSLIESETGGVVLIGPADDGDVVRLQNFLRRNGLPNRLLDPETDPDARDLIARHKPTPSEIPLAVALDGNVLRNPSEHALGLRSECSRHRRKKPSLTSRSSVPGPPAYPPRSMRPRKDCRSPCSTPGRSAGRPAPARVSRIISASRPGFPAWRWPDAPMCSR